ncbi:MAG TPA: S41 family peptidase [archaeon]|nr:S41 family peptidase [archaeon]
MDLKRIRNPYVYGSLTVVVLMMAGWLFGRVLATSDNTYMRVLLLQDVVNQVAIRYVDPIPPEQLYRRAVDGLLKGLDPYTELIPADEYKRFQEIQIKSEYVGTGISISRKNREIVIMSTFPGSSAYREGVQPGDRIISVDGKSAKDWTTEQASLHLLGPEGTKVEVVISRIGVPEPITLTLIRMPVVVPTVIRHFMLNRGVGYLCLSSFTERSAEELERYLRQLQDQGMKSLILDLRDNAGGLTETAIDISQMFLTGKQLIVSIRGRRKEDSKSFFSNGKPLFKDQPMAVLVNDFTASSSEIVAGALQDHDRAVIVGKNSFGKGLVQTTFPLSSGDVLKITTARYYTPSGRNIQRENYRPRRDLLSVNDEEAEEVEEEKPEKPEKQDFYTDMGRKVLGGGGIMPDVVVEEDSAAGSPFIAEILPHSFDFAVAYKSMHPNLNESFRNDKQIFEAFISYLKNQQVTVDPLKIEKYQSFIREKLLNYHIAQVTWDENTAYRLIAQTDKQLAKALEILGSVNSQSEILKKIMKEGSN